MNDKLEYTKELIRCWHGAWDGNVYISFSGGLDSTVLRHIVKELFPDVPAVFCNTGLEYPEIVKFVRTHENVTELRPAKSFRQVIEQHGYPVVSKEQSLYIHQYRHAKGEKVKQLRLNGIKSRNFTIAKKWRFLINAPFEISDQCCEHLKKRPFAKYQKKTGAVPFWGTMAEESRLRLQQLRQHGCNVYDVRKPVSKPLSYWTKTDIWNYIREFDVPYSPIYDMGYNRTGCMFCMYGLDKDPYPDRFQQMKLTHPKHYRFCMDKLGLREVINYVKNGNQQLLFGMEHGR